MGKKPSPNMGHRIKLVSTQHILIKRELHIKQSWLNHQTLNLESNMVKWFIPELIHALLCHLFLNRKMHSWASTRSAQKNNCDEFRTYVTYSRRPAGVPIHELGPLGLLGPRKTSGSRYSAGWWLDKPLRKIRVHQLGWSQLKWKKKQQICSQTTQFG